MKKILGIAIGGTKSAVTFANYENETFSNIEKVTFVTNPNSDQETIESIFKIIEESKKSFDFVSIICGGPLNIKKGEINTPPHLPGFVDTPIVKIFEDKYNCPAVLINDADACALAEYIFGNGRNSNNMAFCTFGTGFGAGLILNGELYTGNNGMAGEIGHIQISDEGPVGYGKAGSIEGWCAGGNIYKWADINGINNTKELFALAKIGDIKALTAIDILAEKLGKAISVLVDTLNLDTVILGGIYPRNLDLLEKKVKESAFKHSLTANINNCSILPSSLGEMIDDYSSLMGFMKGRNMKPFFVKYPELKKQKANIESAIEMLVNCYKQGGKILVCGNGGSAADASHIVGELMKGFMSKRTLNADLQNKLNQEFASDEVGLKLQTGIPCIDLGAQTALLTAFANDVDAELVFAQEVLGYSANSPFDVVIGLSTSGNSKNVVAAIKTAKALGLKTIALTGKKDSKLSEAASICIKAPEEETYKIQEYHLPIYHYICQEVEKRL